jgi:hypothetical protein
LERFLTLSENFARYSKKLIVLNKSDLVTKEELITIKAMIDNQEVKELSLLGLQSSKSRVISYIKEALNLKQELPKNFNSLVEEADMLYSQKNLTLALKKYEEILTICDQFQNFDKIHYFQDKIDELKLEIKSKEKVEKQLERKRSFLPPEQIKFSKRVVVKPLPKAESSAKKMSLKPSIKTYPKSVQKTIPSVKPRIPIKEKEPKKLKLTPDDIKKSLKSKIEHIQKIKQTEPITPKVLSAGNSESPQMRGFEKAENLIGKKEFTLPGRLYELIKNKGSILKPELCQIFIDEMQSVLENPIKTEDLELAADSFVENEKGEL